MCADIRAAARPEPADRALRELEGAEPEGEKVPAHHQVRPDPQDGAGAAAALSRLFISILIK